jgi:phosphoglycolate phosphatase-like HAD superfamily hydrolase
MTAMTALPRNLRYVLQSVGVCLMFAFAIPASAGSDPLASWNNTSPKTAILEFVRRVTVENSPDFVPVRERVAVFDDDGTLWVEHPYSAQLAFEFECAANVLASDQDRSSKQPFKAALDRDAEALAKLGQEGMAELLVATHEGWSTSDYEAILSSWATTTRDTRFKRLYTELTYKPMTELIAYLRANGFQVYIVTSNSVEFVRFWAEGAFDLRPEQIIGSSIATKFTMTNGRPELVRLPEISLVANGAGKPPAVYQRIGRRPIAVFGNSDADMEMFQWATMAKGQHLGVLLHHTDAAREFAYDREAEFGRLDNALSAAGVNGWVVIDMKNDWNEVFPSKAK